MEGRSQALGTGGDRRGRLAALAGRPAAVFALQLAWVALFWGRSLRVDLLSDGYFLLAHAARGLPAALTWDGSYHYYPVTSACLALLFRLFGLWAPGYQAVALLQLTAVGWLTYLLGRRLLGSDRWALLASLLMLGNSSYYEVPAWPINAELHTLAALLYLAGLLVLCRAPGEGRGDGGRAPSLAGHGLAFGGLLLVAFFTYEPTITLAVVGALLVVLLRAAEAAGGGGGRPWLLRAASWRYLLRLFWPAVLAGGVAIASKLWFLAAGAPVTNPAAEPWYGAFLGVRALLALFTLTAPDHRLYRLFSLGVDNSFGSPLMKGLLAGWLVAFGLLALLALWRLRRPGHRFLVLWLAVHLVLVSLVTGVTSRHFLIPALPAALLTAAALRGVARRLGRRRQGGARRRVPAPAVAAVLGVGLLLLAARSWGHARRAIDLHLAAAAANRSVVAAVEAGLAAHPGSRHLLLVNMSSVLSGWGLGAFLFENGLHQQMALRFPGRFARVDLGFTPRLGGVEKMANGSRLVSARELRGKVENRRWIVVLFDRSTARGQLVEVPYW